MRRHGGPSGLVRSRVPWLLRVFLLVGAVQGYAIGLTGLIRPADIVGFPLDTTPLNDRFVASFYLAGAIGLTLSAAVRRASDTRVLVTAFGLVTILLLIATLAYWSDFSAGGVPYAWLVSYIVDPICAGVAIVTLGLWSKERPRPDAVGAIFLLEALLCGALGALLLAAPETAVDIWPWLLTTVLARVYGSIFLALAVAAVLSSLERRPSALVPFAVTSGVFAAGDLVAYALHSSRFDGGAATVVWLLVNALVAAAFAGLLVAFARSHSRVEETSVAILR